MPRAKPAWPADKGETLETMPRLPQQARGNPLTRSFTTAKARLFSSSLARDWRAETGVIR